MALCCPCLPLQPDENEDPLERAMLQAADCRARKDVDGEEHALREALQVNGRHLDALFYMALFLEDHQQDYEGAEAMYRQALEADPRHVNTLCNLGNLLKSHKQDYKGAEAMYRQALEADPRHVNTLCNLGNLLQNHKQPRDIEGAQQCIRRALAIAPNHSWLLAHKA